MNKKITQITNFVKANPIAAILCAIVFLLPYEHIPSYTINSTGTTIKLSQIAGLCLLIGSVSWAIKNYKKFLTSPLIWLWAFFISYGISAVLSQDLKRAAMVFIFTLFTVLVGVMFALRTREEDLSRFEKLLYITTWIVLVFGLYQYAGDLLGLSTKLTGLRPNYVKNIFGFPRIQSTGLEPLFFANFLLIPFFVFSTQYLLAGKKRLGLLTLIVAEVVLTVSRGALVGAVLGIIILVGFLVVTRAAKFSHVWKYLALIAVGVLAAVLMTRVPSRVPNGENGDKYDGASKTERLLSHTTDFNLQDDRVRNRKVGLQAFRENPILGIGPGNFDHYSKNYALMYNNYDNVVVNNEPVEILAEAGIIGAILIFVFFALTFFNAIRAYFRTKDKYLKTWLLGLSVYFVALAVQYQTFSTLYVMHVWVALGILMAVTRFAATKPAK